MNTEKIPLKATVIFPFNDTVPCLVYGNRMYQIKPEDRFGISALTSHLFIEADDRDKIQSSERGFLKDNPMKGQPMIYSGYVKIVKNHDSDVSLINEVNIPTNIKEQIEAEFPYTENPDDNDFIQIHNCNNDMKRVVAERYFALGMAQGMELIRECEEYLSDNHKQGSRSAIAVNTISTNSQLHNRMKQLLSES